MIWEQRTAVGGVVTRSLHWALLGARGCTEIQAKASPPGDAATRATLVEAIPQGSSPTCGLGLHTCMASSTKHASPSQPSLCAAGTSRRLGTQVFTAARRLGCSVGMACLMDFCFV